MKYYRILNNNSKQPFFISCEHAGKKIPKKYGFLGVKKEVIVKNPDYYDVGAEDIARIIAKKFNAKCVLSNYSRLLINLNRSLNNPDLIPSAPYGMDIPLNKKNKKQRLKYYYPYHKRVKKEIEELKKIHKRIYYFCIHTFCGTVKDRRNRKVQIGLLYRYKKDLDFCRKVKKLLEKKTNFIVKINEPYSAFETAGLVMNSYGKSEKVRCIEFEVNDKLLQNKKDIKKIGNLLCNVLKEAV
ncbi:N-formylglutamate amidohydrolase [Candidatus Woesearchaeota archaeon]|nr:N-formylglutamate amidohydrolase [Candidatus Woesearchaeota archaeon]